MYVNRQLCIHLLIIYSVGTDTPLTGESFLFYLYLACYNSLSGPGIFIDDFSTISSLVYNNISSGNKNLTISSDCSDDGFKAAFTNEFVSYSIPFYLSITYSITCGELTVVMQNDGYE